MNFLQRLCAKKHNHIDLSSIRLYNRSDFSVLGVDAGSLQITLIFTFSLCLKSHETNIRTHSCEICDEICKTLTRQVISGWTDFLCRFTGVISGS